MKGRPAVPVHLKLITGNAGRRPVDADPASALDPAIPDCPEHLNAAARAEWQRIVPELVKAGLLSVIDRAALALYCQAFARWQLAEEKIAAAAAKDPDGAGLVSAAKNGFKQLDYWLVISNRAQEQLLKYLQEFGLSPSTRARVAALAKQGSLFDDDPMEGVLSAGRPSAHAS
jgi:P27 family predicted phage terminase small subunit